MKIANRQGTALSLRVRFLIECFSRGGENACIFNGNDKRRYRRYALTKFTLSRPEISIARNKCHNKRRGYLRETFEPSFFRHCTIRDVYSRSLNVPRIVDAFCSVQLNRSICSFILVVPYALFRASYA
jgi:hypothetical protein